MKKIVCCTVLLYLVLSASSYGTVIATSNEEKETIIAEQSGIFYQQLYIDQKEYNDRILNTIYWALGGLGSAIIAIVGLNVFNSYRNNKEGLEVIKKELINSNEKFINKVKTELEEHFNELNEIHSAEISKLIEEATSGLDAGINALSQRVDLDLNQITKDISYTEAVLNRKLKQEELTLCKIEAEVHKLRRVPATAVSMYCKAITLEIELGVSAEYTLGKTLDLLNTFEDVTNFLFQDLSNLIGVLPDKYHSFKLRIEEILKEIKIA
ncbi:hypothetical protein YSY43_26580 [Paenibacillus sp. YSY-4.3]